PGGGKNVDLGTPRRQQARDRLVSDQVLKRSRGVVDVTRLHIRSAVEEQLRDGARGGTMQRGLAVTSALVDRLRTGPEDRPQLVVQSQPGRRPGRNPRATADQRRGLLQRQIPLQNSEATGPPLRARIDICPMLEQYVDDREIRSRLMDGRRVEVEARLVDARANVGVFLEELARQFRI